MPLASLGESTYLWAVVAAAVAAALAAVVVARKLVKGLKYARRPMPLADTTDYDAYWDSRGNSEATRAIIARRCAPVAEECRPGESVLDVGCGLGVLCTMLRDRGCAAVGIDISTRAVEQCRDAGIDAHVVDVSTSALASFLGDRTFDVICCTEVLEHLPNPEDVMRCLGDHARRAIIISVPNAGHWRERLRLLLGRAPLTCVVRNAGEHLRLWTLRDFREWADWLGFECRKVVGLTPGGRKPKAVPSLWATQVMYVLVRRDDGEGGPR